MKRIAGQITLTAAAELAPRYSFERPHSWPPLGSTIGNFAFCVLSADFTKTLYAFRMAKTTISHADRLARRKAIADFIAGGGSMAEACDKFKVTTEPVRRACVEFDVNPPIAGRASHQVLEILADLLNTDDGCTTIAARRRCTPQNVSQIQRRAIAAGIRITPRKLSGAL